MGSIMPTQRHVMFVIDFSHPALYSPTHFMIPAVKSSTNLLGSRSTIYPSKHQLYAKLHLN